MKKDTKTSTKKSNAKRIAIEAGAGVLTAAALAGAAAYWFSGKEGKARRAKVKTWAVKARKEVESNMRKAKKLGAAEYSHLVDQAVKRYGSLENVSAADVMKAARDMKAEWNAIQTHAKKMESHVRDMGQKKTAPRKTGTVKRKTAKSKRKTAK